MKLPTIEDFLGRPVQEISEFLLSIGFINNPNCGDYYWRFVNYKMGLNVLVKIEMIDCCCELVEFIEDIYIDNLTEKDFLNEA